MQKHEPFAWWKLTAAGLLLSVVCGESCADQGNLKQQSSAARPNVLVILTDDQGWGDLSLNGNQNLSTPNIDRLAAEGAKFDRFYVCPVCSPTRAEFLTGRYHARGGVYSTSAGGERLDLDEITIAQSFRAGGYRTAAFGKWHNGMQYPYHPNARGFDLFYGFCSGHWGHYFSPMLERNGEIVQGDGFIIDDLTDQAIDFMTAADDAPFFVYLPYNTPHSPMQVPDRWWNKFKDRDLQMHNRDPKKENLTHIRAALAMCENIDWNVGRIMQALSDSKQADNTIVVYFCDNGPNGTRWNGDMKGRKGSTDEGGVRSPCLVRWPARIAAGHTVTTNGAAIDLHPTLTSLASVKTVNELPLDGVDLSSALLGSDDATDERIIVSQWKTKRSAKLGRWRLDNNGALFDLPADPGQRNNVAARHPDLVQQMSSAIEALNRDTKGHEQDDRPFVIAHPDAPTTQLPARDGKEHGGIKRSNRFPNSSFFTNWTSRDDSITFDAEVLAEGTYEVEIFYSCPKGDEGSTIALSFGDQTLTGKVRVAHPSALVGAAEDRFERMESYEQNWGRMTLGVLPLTAGKGQLKLQATDIPGDHVMDFRLLLLRRQN
ncbi:MAG: sulfatase-like hydrolase/transferase [Planctomycetaceae bacterium]|nr:sulfatase-like hydrolase/transferase [Planctomycetaceae bacterium]